MPVNDANAFLANNVVMSQASQPLIVWGAADPAAKWPLLDQLYHSKVRANATEREERSW